MTILTFPSTVLPTVCSWGLKSLTESFTSPLNNTVQTIGRPGSRWMATLDFGMLNLSQGRQLMGFLAALDGMAGRCYLPNHDRPGAGAAATVNGAGQLGTTIVLNGVAAYRQFLAGDYFSVNGEFKMVTVDTQADAGGNVTLPFAPMLRTSPTSGASVTFTNPTALMMLNQSEFVMPRISGPRYNQFSISFIEVFP